MMKFRHILFLFAFALPMAAFIYAWHSAPPILNSDSAIGFLVWENWVHGGSWNSLLTPDPANLAQDHSAFISWWSPGQYFFPGLLHALFPINWCHATLITALAAILIGSLGVWRLALRLGLSADQAALAALLASISCGVLQGFGMFWGGDIVFGAFVPFLYLAALRTRDLSLVAGFVLFFSACLLGLFCKHGAVLAMGSALLFLVAGSIREQRLHFIKDGRLWLAAAAAALAFICAQLLWVRAGPTPGAGGQVEHALGPSLAFALHGPWFAFTGTGSLLSWLTQRTGLSSIDGWTRLGPWLIFPGLAATLFVTWLGLRRAASQPWRFATCAWLTVSGLMALLYFRGASVSLEERHFRPAAVLLAIAIASSALPVSFRRVGGIVSLGLALFALILGSVAHLRRMHLLSILPYGEVSGFAQPDLPSDAVAAIRAACPPGCTLVLPNPSHAFEFPSQRLLITDAFFRTAEDISHWRYAGTVPALVIAVPATFETDGRSSRLRASFVNVPAHAWHVSSGGGWNVWSTAPSSPGSK